MGMLFDTPFCGLVPLDSFLHSDSLFMGEKNPKETWYFGANETSN